MRSWYLMPMVLVLAAGCSSNPLPAVKHIDQIRLTVNSMPGENPAAAKPREVKIKAQADIVAVMDWLNSIDWSQTGANMAVIDMPPSDGAFMLIDKSAGTHYYSFYWDGQFVNSKANRLIRGGDTEQLKKLVERLLKAG
jgi:hypothetical protein